MSTRLLKTLHTTILTLTMGMSMNADAGLFGFGGDSWKEEVLLHDGQKIILQRVDFHAKLTPLFHAKLTPLIAV